jgi:hypothetical protein
LPSVSNAILTSILVNIGANTGILCFKSLSFSKIYGVSSVCGSSSPRNFDTKSHFLILLHVPSSLLSISNKLFVHTTQLNCGSKVSLSE